MPKTVYDPEIVDAVKKATDRGLTPVEILQAGKIDVTSQTLMAILRDAKEYGWSDIRAEADAGSWLDEDDGDDEGFDEDDGDDEVSIAASPDEQSPSEYDPDDSDKSSFKASGAKAIEDIKDDAQRARRKAGKRLARGKKPANRKNNPVMNRERRRRKGGNVLDHRRRLLMDMKRKHPEFTYRWVLDRPGRIRAMQADDYDIVNDAHIDPEGNGGNVSAVAGTNHYNADNMILMRKYTPWYNDDQAEKQEGAMEFERQINGQKVAGSSLVDNVGPQELIERLKNSGADSTNTYVPIGEKNRVGQVSETLT